MGVSEENELGHYFFVVDIATEAFKFVLQAFLIQIESMRMVTLVRSNDAQIEVDLSNDALRDLLDCLVELLDQP